MTENKDGWIEHDGKGMPVDGETLVNVRLRDGIEFDDGQTLASDWGLCWRHDPEHRNDIIAYRIVKGE